MTEVVDNYKTLPRDTTLDVCRAVRFHCHVMYAFLYNTVKLTGKPYRSCASSGSCF